MNLSTLDYKTISFKRHGNSIFYGKKFLIQLHFSSSCKIIVKTHLKIYVKDAAYKCPNLCSFLEGKLSALFVWIAMQEINLTIDTRKKGNNPLV
jgi:hypothetical protein